MNCSTPFSVEFTRFEDKAEKEGMGRKVKEMKKIFEKKEETVTQKAQTPSGVGNNWIEKIRKQNEVEISRRTDLDKVERSRRTDFREEISRKRILIFEERWLDGDWAVTKHIC